MEFIFERSVKRLIPRIIIPVNSLIRPGLGGRLSGNHGPAGFFHGPVDPGPDSGQKGRPVSRSLGHLDRHNLLPEDIGQDLSISGV